MMKNRPSGLKLINVQASRKGKHITEISNSRISDWDFLDLINKLQRKDRVETKYYNEKDQKGGEDKGAAYKFFVLPKLDMEYNRYTESSYFIMPNIKLNWLLFILELSIPNWEYHIIRLDLNIRKLSREGRFSYIVEFHLVIKGFSFQLKMKLYNFLYFLHPSDSEISEE